MTEAAAFARFSLRFKSSTSFVICVKRRVGALKKR